MGLVVTVNTGEVNSRRDRASTRTPSCRLDIDLVVATISICVCVHSQHAGSMSNLTLLLTIGTLALLKPPCQIFSLPSFRRHLTQPDDLIDWGLVEEVVIPVSHEVLLL